MKPNPVQTFFVAAAVGAALLVIAASAFGQTFHSTCIGNGAFSQCQITVAPTGQMGRTQVVVPVDQLTAQRGFAADPIMVQNNRVIWCLQLDDLVICE